MTTLFQLVKAGTTKLGTDPVRFFEFGSAPELETEPYATFQVLNGEPVNYLAGEPDLDIVVYQIDIWSKTGAELREITKEVRAAIAPAGQITFFNFEWDPESGLFRAILHFSTSEKV